MTATKQIKKGRPNYYIVICYKDEQTNKNKQKWVSTDIPVKGNNVRKADERCVEVLQEFKVQQEEEKKRELEGEKQDDLSKEVLFIVFIKEWLENLKPSIKLVTYDTYRLIVYNQIIPFYEPKKLKVIDITPLHIQQYVNYKLKTVSPNTVRKHLWNLSKCLDSAIKQNLLAINPVKQIDLPKMVKYTGAKFYNEKQIEQLLEVCRGDILENIIKIALFYALRRSELIGLKWDAVDFENNILIIKHTAVQMGTKIHKKDSTKTDSSYRVMPLPVVMKEVFKGIKRNQALNRLEQPNDYIDEGYVFTHVDGRLITPNYVTKHFKWLLTQNSLETIRFHDIRHSSASYLLYLGLDMKSIQMWLGHGEIGTTMNIYAHMDLSGKKVIADNLSERLVHLGI